MSKRSRRKKRKQKQPETETADVSDPNPPLELTAVETESGFQMFSDNHHIRRDCRDALAYLQAGGVLSIDQSANLVRNLYTVGTSGENERDQVTATKCLMDWAKFSSSMTKSTDPGNSKVGHAHVHIHSGSDNAGGEPAVNALEAAAAELGFQLSVEAIPGEETDATDIAGVVVSSSAEGPGPEKRSSER